MEIDVREEKEDKPDVIRWADEGVLEVNIASPTDSACYLSPIVGKFDWRIPKEDIPNLIKALKKYQELYGE